MPALYSHTTRATGLVLTAAIYNADHQNHIDNGVPAQLDDYSINVTQMQAMTDPGDVGSESLATTLAGEIERLRFKIDQIIGGAQWYSDPVGSLVAASETVSGLVELATNAEIRSATTGGKVVEAADLETASALVALTDAATVAVDWDTGINFSLTIAANRIIGNPTNGQPGTWRSIIVQGNDATDRTITFDTQYLGSVPTITDCDNGRWYLLTIFCVTSTHFVVSSKKAKGT